MTPATIERMDATGAASARIGAPGVTARLGTALAGVFGSDIGPRRGYRARLVAPIFLLVFLSNPVHNAFHSGWPVGKVAVVVAGLATFAACFIVVVWKNTPLLHRDRAALPLIAGAAVGVALVPALGVSWLSALSIYTVSMVLFNYDREYWLATLVVVPGLTWLAATAFMGKTASGGLEIGAETLLIGTIQAAFYSQIRAKVALHQAQAELARLAVTEERLRIARDLHDILGQRLSAVSLKAEVAARLVYRDPVQAATEMGEVASVARAALTDVRQTVSGYRNIRLRSEIETATTLLNAAGVTVHTAVEAMPRPIDECAGWLVREAATNVIRHASASGCVIRASRSGTSAVIEVSDDGSSSVSAGPVYGNGLTGLSERVNAIGGNLTARRERGWFVVRASFDNVDIAALETE